MYHSLLLHHNIPQANSYGGLNTELCACCCVLQACSEYHYLLLYADKLVAINQVSGKVAAEVSWGPGSHTPSISGELLMLCTALCQATPPTWLTAVFEIMRPSCVAPRVLGLIILFRINSSKFTSGPMPHSVLCCADLQARPLV